MTDLPDPLVRLGWDDAWANAFAPHAAEGLEPARVVLEHQHIYRLAAIDGEPEAVVAGRFRHQATARADYPAVGDWVAVSRPPGSKRRAIQAVLPRRSRFLRKVAGAETEAQVVAANIDLVFLVSGLDDDYNPRRIERYLVTAWQGGATPVVILNKADLCDDVAARLAEIARIAPEVAAHAVSCRAGTGLAELDAHLRAGTTIALLGSSGVGKSTIINALIGFERQRTRDVRAHDSRGRHTTTNRELVALPGGALLIDTPGMRELQLWTVGEAIEDAFDDIRQAGQRCRFRDCRHETEPRCAVKAAVEAGEIPRERWQNFLQLEREVAQLAARQDQRAGLEAKRQARIIGRAAKKHRPRSSS